MKLHDELLEYSSIHIVEMNEVSEKENSLELRIPMYRRSLLLMLFTSDSPNPFNLTSTSFVT